LVFLGVRRKNKDQRGGGGTDAVTIEMWGKRGGKGNFKRNVRGQWSSGERVKIREKRDRILFCSEGGEIQCRPEKKK